MGLNYSGGYTYPGANPAWLALHREDIIDPALPIVDAHHHLWDEPSNPYGIDDLIGDLDGGHNIVATLFAQCHWGHRDSGPDHLRPVGETERVEAVRRDAWLRRPDLRPCAGIVGFVDLMLGERVAEVIEAHLAVSPVHFRGVRQSVARDSHFPDGIVLKPAPAGMMEDPRFHQGLRQVARRGLCFDAMLYHEQIPALTALARAVPDIQIILDHYGCPLAVGPYLDRRDDVFRIWRRDIAVLASCPNVAVKMGGMGMVINGAAYHLAERPPASKHLAASWRPFVETCIEAFGTGRCLFESNFPVDKAMYSYEVLWNAFKLVTKGATLSEKNELFSGTASRLYRLDIDEMGCPGGHGQ